MPTASRLEMILDGTRLEGYCYPMFLQAHLPVDYPSTSAPVIQLRRDGLDGELLSDAVSQLESMFAPGEVVVFMMVEWLKTQDWLVPEEAVDGEGGDVGPVTERMGECTVDDASGAESEGTCQEAEDEGLTVKVTPGHETRLVFQRFAMLTWPVLELVFEDVHATGAGRSSSHLLPRRCRCPGESSGWCRRRTSASWS